MDQHEFPIKQPEIIALNYPLQRIQINLWEIPKEISEQYNETNEKPIQEK